MTLMRLLPHRYRTCLTLRLCLLGCEKPGEHLTWFRNSKREFPITRTLMDNTGRQLDQRDTEE